MSFRRDAPLRHKLTLLSAVCSLVALVTAAVALGTYEWFVYRKNVFGELATMSAIAARNSAAALAFANQDDANHVLAALEAEPTVLAATLYDAAGRQFASYRRAGIDLATPLLAPADGIVETGTRLELAVPVAEGKRFGTLLVQADVSVVSDRLQAYVLVLLGTTAIAGLVAFLLSGWLARRIAAPVQALAAAASAVKTTADYRIRATKTGDDELGALTDAFNDMLARIERNESDLYRSTERLRLALESAKIGTWEWDLVRDEQRWNERNYEIFGLAPGTRITTAFFFAQVHPDDRGRVKTAVEESARSSSDFAVEFRLARAERSPRHVAARGRFLKASASDPLRAVGVMIDVSERRGAELRVIESEQRFRVVAERAPALIWSCDAALQRDYFNKTWLAFTGRTFEQEAGIGWQAGLPGADMFRWQETVRTAAAQADPYTIEYRLRRADGALRWVVETGSPRRTADGLFAGFLGSCIDITARKENEAELEAHVRRRTRELEVANQELESFSYSVSHDLRGPVRAIQGFAEIALEECEAKNPAGALDGLHRVIRAAERMNKLIDAFISMARISRTELRVDQVDLSKMAEEVVAFLRATVPERAIEVVIAPALQAPGDERLLRIVLENLLGNAWKFTARRERARIEFGMQPQDGERVFLVRDNGAGFNPELAHKLFQAFERLHNTKEFEGLGVGLNTVQRIIEKHDGRVWAESVEGEGATFYFTLAERPARGAATSAVQTATA
ncbi:MAG TPA: PAS domain-containing protein [Opitutaceae bacterium]|nr:PAS domain-containing protein [Opitutaceae bacterium]